MPIFGIERWTAAWDTLQLRPPAGALERLLAGYAEPHRAYHTVQHLEECFDWLDRASDLADRPAEVALAVWFHDAIYETRSTDSEERSARLAREVLDAAGAAEEIAFRIEQMILATKHGASLDRSDTGLLLDVDLSILGARPERFAEYELQVRREFEWVPEPAFRAARRRILAGFLERSRLYSTDWFAERLEPRARDNLARSLEALSHPRPGD